LKVEVLISTMNRKDYSFIDNMNLNSDFLIINQNCEEFRSEKLFGLNKGRIISLDEKGLSKSRNLAIQNSTADICILADDDVSYINNYSEIVCDAYKKYCDADIIAFQMHRIGTKRSKVYRNEQSWENYISCVKISSVEITFKRESIINSKIKFNELMGSGSEFYLGEENIFLCDALKKGLKILYLPIKIGCVDCSKSTWFEGYNSKYFISRGALFYNMSNIYYIFLIIQFAIRKYNLYNYNLSFFKVIIFMIEGVKKYKSYKKIISNDNDIELLT